jgi:hypothetical protein
MTLTAGSVGCSVIICQPPCFIPIDQADKLESSVLASFKAHWRVDNNPGLIAKDCKRLQKLSEMVLIGSIVIGENGLF